MGTFGARSNIEVGSRALGARDLRPFLSLLLDLALPAGCPACAEPLGSGPTRFCGGCEGAMPRISRPLCTRCGLPFFSAIANHPCGACLARPPAFRAARAAGRYEGALLDSIHRLKFGGDLVQAPALAALLPRALASLGGEPPTAAAVLPSPLHVEIDARPAPDLVIPVPLHPRRLRERGFNQAHVIAAEAVRAGLFAPWTRLAPWALARVRETPAQTRLSRPERLTNLRAAFTARPDAVRGRTVLLVDDVMTTGATLDACARALLRAGAREVDAVVVARVCP
jgi:ComF family protein